MAFWGHSFVYAGVPCEDFDLMIYDVGGSSQDASQFGKVEIIEDTVNFRQKPYFYGTVKSGRLEFSMVFGVNTDRIDDNRFLDRSEMEAIAHWLMGNTKYQYLEIEQEDMEYARYKCLITGIEMVEYGNIPWALKATVSCDSNYAYLYPQKYTYSTANGQSGSGSTKQLDISFYNECTAYEYYYPKITFLRNQSTSSGTWDAEIVNESDGDRSFAFEGIPKTTTKIVVDCENGVITASNASGETKSNMYEYFNFNFLRLKPGVNKLVLIGKSDPTITAIIECEFPVMIGG